MMTHWSENRGGTAKGNGRCRPRRGKYTQSECDESGSIRVATARKGRPAEVLARETMEKNP